IVDRYATEPSGSRPAFLVALGRIRDPRALPTLLAATEEPASPTVVSAIHALGDLGLRKGAPRLRMLLTSPVRTIRGSAAEGLGRLGGGGDVAPLMERLADPDPWVRRGASVGLGYLRARRAASALRARLSDPDSEVRLAAVWAIGRIGDPRSRPRLLAMLEEAVSPSRQGEGDTGASGGAGASVIAEREGSLRLRSDAPQTLLDALLLALAREAARSAPAERGRILEALGRAVETLPWGQADRPLALPRMEHRDRGPAPSRREVSRGLLPGREKGGGPGR
ncbi:hypothetical protein B1B_14095, partial [mine drainage metagenome]